VVEILDHLAVIRPLLDPWTISLSLVRPGPVVGESW